MSEDVITRREGRTLIVTINRPDVRNAINASASRGLADAMDILDDDQDLSVAILTGAGGTFCAGMDLKAFVAGEDIAVEGRGLGFTERPPRKPVIAAIEGYALAGGTELALACDLIVAGRSARFGLPEVKRGLVAGGGGLLRLPSRIPYQVAMELALTGEPFTAEQAHRYGLVNRCVDDGSALEAALELATVITANGPLAVAATKEIIVAAQSWTTHEAFAKQKDIMMPVFASEDAREGAQAFAEKRAPRWLAK